MCGVVCQVGLVREEDLRGRGIDGEGSYEEDDEYSVFSLFIQERDTETADRFAPGEPGGPCTPGLPLGPMGPWIPGGPAGPVGPVGPEIPGVPGLPSFPGAPVAPWGPLRPCTHQKSQERTPWSKNASLRRIDPSRLVKWARVFAFLSHSRWMDGWADSGNSDEHKNVERECV